MTIKLILLKSGEDIISDLQEMLNENGNVIGYYLNKPCIVKIKDLIPESLEDTEDISKKAKINLILYPWMPLSKDLSLPIPSDWVVTIVEPITRLVDMYKQDVLKFNKNDQSTNFDEQPNTDNTD